jgi:CheY-like chemotaxis protein/MinD-like ATPase involved in chromosome partitioning or flagellar assembly
MPEKVLIVDDDLDTLKLVGLILQRHGYGIVAANGGVSALAKAAADKPDLILLDLMMPDLDGYEVARRMRADAALAHIPIIMFTAKTMLDDKVAGFEAGADDYLTKPTHPSELIAHVKALLARTQGSRAAAAPPTAFWASFLGAKGGVGTTTLAINFAAAAAQTGAEVLLADLHPGTGSMGMMLGLNPTLSLAALLTKPPAEINQRSVTPYILSHVCGIRVLAGQPSPNDAALMANTAQWEALVKTLSSMCKLLVLDMGTGLPEYVRRILANTGALVLAADPTRLSLSQTKIMLAELATVGQAAARVEIAIVNRSPSSIQISIQQAEQIVGHRIAGVVSPAAELAYQSHEVGTPMVLLRPESLTADQLRVISNLVLQKVRGPKA